MGSNSQCSCQKREKSSILPLNTGKLTRTPKTKTKIYTSKFILSGLCNIADFEIYFCFCNIANFAIYCNIAKFTSAILQNLQYIFKLKRLCNISDSAIYFRLCNIADKNIACNIAAIYCTAYYYCNIITVQ